MHGGVGRRGLEMATVSVNRMAGPEEMTESDAWDK